MMNRGLMGDFKEFIMQGNVVSLAVAVVIGAAFTAIVTSVVDNLIMPLIALIGGQPDFGSIGFHISDTYFGIGNILNAIIYFLIVAAIVFFFVVKPMNALMDRAKTQEPEDPTITKCPYCFTIVSVEATRCPACTSELQASSATVS